MHSLGAKIRGYREANDLSQEQLAEMLGVSRPAIGQIEKDERRVKAEELKKLSEIFDISIDFLLSGEQDAKVAISEEQQTRFKQLMLYILSQVGAKYNVGKVVLYKLLYFAEFDYYEAYQKHISGYPFIKMLMGPAPKYFDFLITEMKNEKTIISVVAPVSTPHGTFYQQRYIPTTEVHSERFTQEEKACIDKVLRKYSDLSAKDISYLSHQDKPWLLAQDMGIIDYGLVKFREYPFSVLAQQERLTADITSMQNNRAFDFLLEEPDIYDDLV